MKKITYVVKDPLGIHARPAGELVKKVKEYQSVIKIGKSDKVVDARGIMGIMGLAVKAGDEIFITAEGVDEEPAMKELDKFLHEKL